MTDRHLTEPLLAISGLSIGLPVGADRARAVDDIALTIARDEVLCVVGESGSGKSLTAHAVLGLVPKGLAVTGSIRFEGRELLGMAEAERRRLRGSRMAMIFQEPMAALNPVMRIGDQIGEVFRFHGRADRDGQRTLALLEAVGLPDPALIRHARPFQLSGGQRQRAMIAMALALDPVLLIADEPTTALDVTTQAQILALLRSIQAARSMAVMLITHDIGVVREMADRVAVMQEGRVVETGVADEVLRRPQHPYTRRLLAAVPRLQPRPDRSAELGDTILEGRGIAKSFGGRGGLFRPARRVQAVAGVDLTLRRGEALGIVGESGSGKSTLARLIVRLIDADAGTLTLSGLDGNLLKLGRGRLAPVRRRVQMVFQDPWGSLNPRRRVHEIVAQGLLAHGVDRRTARARVDELLALVALDPSAAERFPNEFSGGQRQRIGLARALALEPELLVADEPVSALDVSVQAQVLELLADIQRKLRLSILFITHDLRVASQVCDRIAVMRRGVVVETGPVAEVLFRPRHEYTRLLLASVPGREGEGEGAAGV
ncbi:ABC transporter ATP-binding protein [Allostella humosa]|uniref:ABC transporter ATP-binding protein n=1 Tax=Stella humosa TaxID=94 RepID=UPI000F4CAFF4|nr:ABC transporter ATP-binding protein [Stella humosa]